MTILTEPSLATPQLIIPDQETIWHPPLPETVLDDVLRIRIACMQCTEHQTPGGVPFLKPLKSREEVQNLLEHMLLLFDDADVAGCLHIKPLDHETGLLGGVAVDPKKQGRGYGPKLLHAGIQYGINQKFHQLISMTASECMKKKFEKAGATKRLPDALNHLLEESRKRFQNTHEEYLVTGYTFDLTKINLQS